MQSIRDAVQSTFWQGLGVLCVTSALACTGGSGREHLGTSGVALKSSAGPGDWKAGATWSDGIVPTPGESVQVEHEVTLYESHTIDEITISGDGQLKFDPSSSVTLTATGNIVVAGQLQMRPADATVTHEIVFSEVDESAYVGGGMLPLATDVGLWITEGGVWDAKGTPKTSWTRLTSSADALDLTIEVEDASGWRPDDVLVVVPTLPPDSTGSSATYDSGLRIDSVDGNQVTLRAPLNFDHPEVYGQWRAEVLNLSRNVKVQGTTSGRAHVMFTMLNDDNPQTLSYVEIAHMGPRQPDAANPGHDKAVLGRYGLHFHMLGDAAKDTDVDGLALHDLGSHAFVPHGSHSITVRNSLSHNTREEAFWWDPGTAHKSNDISFDHDVASLAVASVIQRNAGFMLGEGDGNRVINSVAVGVDGNVQPAGFVWPEPDTGVPSAWTFHDNIAHNNRADGIFTWQNGSEDHLVERFVGYRNGKNGIEHGAYSNRYDYRNIQLIGNREVGVVTGVSSQGDEVSGFRFDNLLVDGEGVTQIAFKVMEHPTNIALSSPTVVQNSVFKNLHATLRRAVHFRYQGVASGTDLGGGAGHREWIRFVNNDFSDMPADRHFFLEGSVQGGVPHGVLADSDIFVESPEGSVYTVRSTHFDPTLGDDFAGTNGAPWAWFWVNQHGGGRRANATLQGGRGNVTASAGESGRELYYVKTHQGSGVSQSATVRITDSAGLAGLFAHRDDLDRESYYMMTIGTSAASNALTIAKVIDGVVTTLATGTDYLTTNTDSQISLNVTPTGAATQLSAKACPSCTPLTVTDSEARLQQQIGGRYGVVADTGTAGTVSIDVYYSQILDSIANDSNWNAKVQQWVPSGAPSVSVGSNLSAFLPNAGVQIDASVADGSSASWSHISGPGNVTFSSPNSADTWAGFSTAGIHVLRLTAASGPYTHSKDLRVIVSAPQSALPEQTWTGSNGAAWPSPWTVLTSQGSPTVDIQSNQGRIYHGARGSAVAYVNDRAAEEVEVVARIHFNNGNAQGGVLARLSDLDPDTYLGVKFGRGGTVYDHMRIFKMVDGAETPLVEHVSPLGGSTTPHWIRFRLETNVDGSMNLRAKIWADGSTPPAEWTQEVLNWSNAIFKGRAGRFGVIGDGGQAGRAVYVDNFGAEMLDAAGPVQVEEHWPGANGDAWPSSWARTVTGTNNVVRVQNTQGEFWCTATCTSSTLVASLPDHSAADVDLKVKVRLDNNNSRGGLFARWIDENNYLAVRSGASGASADYLRIYAVVNGTATDIGSVAAAAFTQHVDAWLRFVVTTNSDLNHTTHLLAKIWPADGMTSEPGTWTIARDYDNATFNQRAGRFGVIAQTGQANRTVKLDDFLAVF